MIFPGMDPYLESPRRWPGVHNTMIVYLRDHLQDRLGNRYVCAVDERVFVERPDRDIRPDVWLKRIRVEGQGQRGVAVAEIDEPTRIQVTGIEIHESYISILDMEDHERVVTVIEVVSPSNKTAGAGRNLYLQKQLQVLESDTHLVEIDLLRTGQHVLAVPAWIAEGQRPFDSLISINRAGGPRDVFDLYARGIRDRLPRIGIPLADNDPDAPVDLQMVLQRTYEAGKYQHRIDYHAPCRPPLPAEDQAWADEQVTKAEQSSR